jgi:site-specific DNA-cytosine methylase
MIIYDFFAGTGSATKAFEDQGHKVIKIELDSRS